MVIELPSMVAGRGMADALVDRLAGDLRDADVVLDCRRLVTGSPSFAAQVVSRVLGGGARRLRVEAAPASFAEDVRRAARRLGADDRLDVVAPQPTR